MVKRRPIQADEKVPLAQLVPLSARHVFTMFGTSVPIIGGIPFLLCGMIGTSGLRVLVDKGADHTRNRNPILTPVVFVADLSGLTLTLGAVPVTGMTPAALTAVVLSPVFHPLEKLGLPLSSCTAAPPFRTAAPSLPPCQSYAEDGFVAPDFPHPPSPTRRGPVPLAVIFPITSCLFYHVQMNKAPKALRDQGFWGFVRYSHSMVAGGFEVMS